MTVDQPHPTATGDPPVTTVVGGGAWGTALASMLAAKGVPTTIWAREAEVVDDIATRHENRMYLAGWALSDELDATGDLDAAIAGADVVINAVPTQHMRSVYLAATGLADRSLLVSVSKGIEISTLMTPNEILGELGVPADRIVALSGPSFAAEVVAEQPTAVTVAGIDPDRLLRARTLLSTPTMRAYSSPDIVSVELGGALKNVIAIAVGIADGLGFGANTRAALITRGLAEITRLGVARGGDALTFAGLSGLGDLVLTCTGDLSRNRSVGLEIGRGKRLADILAGMDEVTEGVHTSLAARELAARVDVELPITEQVCLVLHEDKDPRRAVLDLLARDSRDEQW